MTRTRHLWLYGLGSLVIGTSLIAGLVPSAGALSLRGDQGTNLRGEFDCICGGTTCGPCIP